MGNFIIYTETLPENPKPYIIYLTPELNKDAEHSFKANYWDGKCWKQL